MATSMSSLEQSVRDLEIIFRAGVGTQPCLPESHIIWIGSLRSWSLLLIILFFVLWNKSKTKKVIYLSKISNKRVLDSRKNTINNVLAVLAVLYWQYLVLTVLAVLGEGKTWFKIVFKKYFLRLPLSLLLLYNVKVRDPSGSKNTF